MRPQIIVVEGRNDVARLKQVMPDIRAIAINGSAIEPETVKLLKKLEETHDIVLFLDPDHAGERIRRLLSKTLKQAAHVFIEQDKARSTNGKKTGIEHVSPENLQQALKHMVREQPTSKSDITHAFLHETGLVGHKNSQMLRKQLSARLHLGHVNGKTLYHRLHLFQITKARIREVLDETSNEKEIWPKLPQGPESTT
ncbi:MAG: ribonuclease M5 [Acholeplasmataceae bacterium]|nr:MAG: ribonuclease M5 [Acholeplasmataceae bacterium]